MAQLRGGGGGGGARVGGGGIGGGIGRVGGIGGSRIGGSIGGGIGSVGRVGGASIGGAYRGIGGIGAYGYGRGPIYGGYRYGYPYGYGYGYPWGYGLGFGYWPWYDYPTYSPYVSYYPYVGDYSYPYQPQQTVVYSQPSQNAPAVTARQQYDEYGQEIRPSASPQDPAPIYLIALKGGVVYAASSYQFANGTVDFVTLDHVKKQTPVAGIDRDLTLRLNRQRGVVFSFPQ
jgi:hypothetical protein